MTAELVLAAVAKPGKSLRDLRNRAMLLIGFAGAFRRSELIGLDVADVTETDDGLLLHIRRSKTDQEGHGRKVAIPPWTALPRGRRSPLGPPGIANEPRPTHFDPGLWRARGSSSSGRMGHTGVELGGP